MAIEKFDGGSDMLKELHITLKENTNTDKNIKHNNKVKNIFRNTFIVGSLISMLNLWTPFSIQNYYLDKQDTIIQNVENEIMKIIDMKDINNIDTYKNELDKILNNKEFKDIISVKIYTNIPNNVTQTIDDENHISIKNLTYNYKNEKSPNSILRSSRYAANLDGKSSSDNKIYYVLEINSSNEEILDNALIATIFISIISLITYMYLLAK